VRTLDKSGGRGDEQTVDGELSSERVKCDQVVVVVVDDDTVLVMYSGTLQHDVLSHARSTAPDPRLACTPTLITAPIYSPCNSPCVASPVGNSPREAQGLAD